MKDDSAFRGQIIQFRDREAESVPENGPGKNCPIWLLNRQLVFCSWFRKKKKKWEKCLLFSVKQFT